MIKMLTMRGLRSDWPTGHRGDVTRCLCGEQGVDDHVAHFARIVNCFLGLTPSDGEMFEFPFMFASRFFEGVGKSDVVCNKSPPLEMRDAVLVCQADCTAFKIN